MKKVLIYIFFCFFLSVTYAIPVTIDAKRQLNFKIINLHKPMRCVVDVPRKHLLKSIKTVNGVRVGVHKKFIRLVFSQRPTIKNVKVAKNHYRYYLSTKSDTTNKIVVVIDPGHGGFDPGALGVSHVKEKQVVLSIAKILHTKLNSNPHFKAFLTRKTDKYLTLRQRLAIARHYHADCFLAIHADAFLNKKAHGISVYALSERGASSESARWLANQENNSELMGGAKLNLESRFLSKMLIGLQQEITSNKSLQLGQLMLDDLAKVAHLHNKKVGQAAFVVLKSPDIISLLIETGFVSNKREAKLLSSHRYQVKLASSIYKALVKYYPVARHTVIVKKGDTLYSIAKNKDISIHELVSINNIKHNKISVGQKLNLIRKVA